MNIRQMLSRISNNLLVWLAAAAIALCACDRSAKELASYWDGHDFSSLDGFSDIKEAEDKFDGYVDLLS